MDERTAQSSRCGCRVFPEISAEFHLRLAPVRLCDESGRREHRVGYRPAHTHEEVEFEVEIEATECAQIVSLHFHGFCYADWSAARIASEVD